MSNEIEFSLGSILAGRFRLISELGAGGMGVLPYSGFDSKIFWDNLNLDLENSWFFWILLTTEMQLTSLISQPGGRSLLKWFHRHLLECAHAVIARSKHDPQ